MKAVVAAFNQEKALVGAFSVITNLRVELFQALVMSESVMLGRTVSCYCHYWRFLLVFLATHPPCSQYGANETVIIGILPRQGAADGLSQVVILFQSFIHLGKMKNQNNLIKCECVREMFIVYFLHHEQSHALNGAGCEHGTSI